MAIAKITLFRNGRAQATTTRSVFGNFAASASLNIVSGAGFFNRVRVRLYNGNVTALGDGTDTWLATRNFKR
jgi:hypothetical protein